MIKPQLTVRFYQRRAGPPRGDLTSSPEASSLAGVSDDRAAWPTEFDFNAY